MEVPYEREEEEVMGMELETRRKKMSHLSKKPFSPTNSDGSCVSTDSLTDSNFEYFSCINTTNNLTTNGENHKFEVATHVIQEELVLRVTSLAETQDKNANFEGIDAAEIEGTNGFPVHQNGVSVVHFLRESNGGDKEMDVGSNGPSFSKSSDSAVGLKYVESLLDESSNGVIQTDTFNAENGISSQNQNAGVHRAKELEAEVEEYDVERVIQKQETHDLYCPNCSSCITKRVILRRRKRKLQELSTGEEAPTSGLDQSGLPEIEQPPQVEEDLESRVDGISCFSCFSIFIPTGDGFLSWRFKPKADVARQSDATSTDTGQAEDSQTDSRETIFPLWVVTCCQPAEGKKSDGTAPPKSGGRQPDHQLKPDIEASPHQTQPPLPLSDAGINAPAHSTHTPIPHKSDLGRLPVERSGVGTPLQSEPLNSINPYGGTTSSEAPPPITTHEASNFPLWIMTCCQPSVVGKKTDHPEKPDGTVAQREPPSAPSGGIKPPLAPSDDTPIPPFKPKPPAIHVPGTSSPFKPITPTNHNDDIPLPPQTGSPPTQGNGVLAMPPKPQPPVIQPDSYGAGPLVDVEPGLGREPRRAEVSGVDIIKAIVYGGLLESITSLSVITSAAGGDATTLNIVALGLANVFGGLVVLVHNLRMLKHEHATEHYEAQLGRPGHYMLHAIVAIISYLVFGLMSPLIYGFSFRKSDNKDYKLAILAASALAGITILSAAKAYVRNPPKGYIKTVFYYISLGFMVSGLGYVAGDVINMLLKKLGVFDPSAPDNVPVVAAGLVNGAWSSY